MGQAQSQFIPESQARPESSTVLVPRLIGDSTQSAPIPNRATPFYRTLPEQRQHMYSRYQPYANQGRPRRTMPPAQVTCPPSQQVSADTWRVYYIYCIKLPSFECRIRAQQSQEQRTNFTFGQVNPEALPFNQSVRTPRRVTVRGSRIPGLRGRRDPLSALCRPALDDVRLHPHFTMVKVGISTKPGKRLYEIMRGFEGFGATDGMQFDLNDSDSSDDTVEKSKSNDNVVFIKKFRSTGEAAARDSEKEIRQLIGRDLGESFRDQFKESLGEDDRRQRSVDKVGITEWVLVPTHLITDIKQEFRQDWSQTSNCTRHPTSFWCVLCLSTGQQFHSQIESIKKKYQMYVNLAQAAHKVTITFPSTKFSYDVDIEHPLQ